MVALHKHLGRYGLPEAEAWESRRLLLWYPGSLPWDRGDCPAEEELVEFEVPTAELKQLLRAECVYAPPDRSTAQCF